MLGKAVLHPAPFEYQRITAKVAMAGDFGKDGLKSSNRRHDKASFNIHSSVHSTKAPIPPAD
jgi:hypothetical protein